MRRVLTLIPAFLIVLIYACHSEQVNLSYPLPSSSSILSRGESESTSLPVGSQILLNANGGISLENEIFTYNGNIWTNGQDIDWTEFQTETTVTALYPTYADNQYTSDNLYVDGTLEDVLIAQETLQEKGEINLHFKHLFSSLTLNLDPILERNLQEIALSVPVQAEEISPIDGTISLISSAHTSRQSNNGSQTYTFILPPTEECTLTLLLTREDGSFQEVSFNPHTFISGARYECNITSTDSRPGIRNAEDLITFSQLINGTYTGEETLASFGEQTEGQTTYRLLADISLTEEECSQLVPIGTEDVPFADIFDGEGHILSQLLLPNERYTGLFGHIGTTGVIRNLHITEASSTQAETCQYTGIIAANNDGTIDHCSVKNSTIHTIEKGYMGGICALTSGTILNCYTQDISIQVNNNTIAGGITGSASGNILNCYSIRNMFSVAETGYRLGSIAGMSGPRTTRYIDNCYIYHNQSSKYWGAAVGTASRVTIRNFYYNRGEVYNTKDAKTIITNTAMYDSGYCIDAVPISQLLNEWIETTGATSYPEFTFYKWVTASDGSACFQ